MVMSNSTAWVVLFTQSNSPEIREGRTRMLACKQHCCKVDWTKIEEEQNIPSKDRRIKHPACITLHCRGGILSITLLFGWHWVSDEIAKLFLPYFMNMDESNLIATENRKSMTLKGTHKEKEYMVWKDRAFTGYVVNGCQ